MIATAFRSEARFTQEEFSHWLTTQPVVDTNHYELLNGHIVMEPPAGWRHGSVGAVLVELLCRHVRGQRLGVILDASAGIDLPSGDTVEPDVTYVSHEQLSAESLTPETCFLRAVPSLVIEILSPSTARRDRGEKKAIYERNGVREYWIVDPEHREVAVFHLNGHRYDSGTFFRTGTVRSQVLPALAIELAQVFEL